RHKRERNRHVLPNFDTVTNGSVYRTTNERFCCFREFTRQELCRLVLTLYFVDHRTSNINVEIPRNDTFEFYIENLDAPRLPAFDFFDCHFIRLNNCKEKYRASIAEYVKVSNTNYRKGRE